MHGINAHINNLCLKKIKRLNLSFFIYFVPPTSCYLELALIVKLLSGTILL